MAGASAFYRLGAGFMHGISTSIHVLFGLIFYYFIFPVTKGIKNGRLRIVEIRDT